MAKSIITMNQYEKLMSQAADKIAELHDKNSAQADEITALRDALKQMLYIFDRDLETGTVGRIVCDVAIEALKGDTK